jgi:hypothetical protein
MLTLDVSDSGAGLQDMSFSNTGFAWYDWIPFATSAKWTLMDQDGPQVVHCKVRDKAGNEADLKAEIILDRVGPVLQLGPVEIVKMNVWDDQDASVDASKVTVETRPVIPDGKWIGRVYEKFYTAYDGAGNGRCWRVLVVVSEVAVPPKGN